MSAAAAATARLALSVSAAAAAAARQRAASTLAVAAAANAAPAQPARIVLESDIPPIPIPDETLPQYLWRKGEKLAHHPCISCGVSKRTFTYSEVRDLSRRWGLALAGQLGMGKGDVIALLLPNLPEYLPAVQGALLAGLRVTMANPLYTAEELRRQFTDAGAKAVLTVLPLADKVRTAMGPTTKLVVLLTEKDEGKPLPKDGLSWQRLVDDASEADATFPTVSPDDVAAVPYSSGTTGLPKGVMLTHRNLVADIELMDIPELRHTLPTTDTFQETALTVLPYFHIYGFNGVLNVGVVYGMHNISMPGFTPEDYLRCLVEYKPSTLSVVPSLLQFLAVHPSVTREMLEPVRTIVSGAAPATQSLLDKFREKSGRDDLLVRQGYGMTESSPVTLLVPRSAPRAKELSMGRLLPNTRARVVRSDGRDAGPGEPGELLVLGPQVMKGYLGNEKATQETIDEEGWLHTGDVVYYDDERYFFIVDRTKELIKVKGNQVSPTELENIVMELPEVADCAVVGVPHERYDEVPRAFVVMHPNKKLTEEQIKKHLEPKVVKYKRLEGGVIFLDKIPRNPSGKIMRPTLKNWKPEQ